MNSTTYFVGLSAAIIMGSIGTASAQSAAELGTEEFGMTERELFQSIDQVESLIAGCMRNEGFQYFAVDTSTVRNGMMADKSLPGISEEEFIGQHGFGISTLYTGEAPQQSTGYSPGKVGLGGQNIDYFNDSLSPADQIAYNRALLGSNTNETFAVGLETENFSRTGGCTRTAIEEIFDPEELHASYYNPKDALINKDPRMQAALQEFSAEMRDAGFEYDHPDDVEVDVKERLMALTEGGSIKVADMSSDQQAALQELQDYERRVAIKTLELTEELFDPVEAIIEEELFARDVK